MPLVSLSSFPYRVNMMLTTAECFLDCHARAINSVNLPGQPSNSYQAYGPNCNLPVSFCLVFFS